MATPTHRARPPIKKIQNRGDSLKVWLSPRDKETFRLAAEKRGISVSELVRRTASMLEMADKTEGANIAITLGDKLVGIVAGL